MKLCISFNRCGLVAIALLGIALLPRVALANFHVMEIEQIVGGVGGDTTAQAVQLKMRIAGQQFVAGQAILVARDAAGANPVTLSSFPAPNPLGGACVEILLATPGMAAKTTPPVTGAYTMAQIPASHLAAGSLTFEGIAPPTVYWRVSWGGAGYTGPQTVAAGVNDADSSTAPAFAGPLPSTAAQALRFVPACGALSTNTAADYALTAGAAVLKNNAQATFTVGAVALPIPGLPAALKLLLPSLLGLALVVFAIQRRRSA